MHVSFYLSAILALRVRERSFLTGKESSPRECAHGRSPRPKKYINMIYITLQEFRFQEQSSFIEASECRAAVWHN